jgi:glutamyl-tRNA synthetase
MVIRKADGSPTYNFCVVVDDMDMGITHVVRGDDHINNTPKQINIYEALDAVLPVFAHVPMILGPDGAKLSKRHGAVNVMQYREDGYLPQAMLNYLVRLGWSYGDKEIFSVEEMIENFTLENISSSASRFDFDKLKWLNRHYLKESNYEDIKPEVEYHFAKAGIDTSNGPDTKLLLEVMAEKVDTLTELVEKSKYFYQNISNYDEKAVKKHFKSTTGDILLAALAKFSALSDEEWLDESVLHSIIGSTAEQCECGMGKVGMPVRVSVTGSGQSPDIGVTLKLLGKEKVLARLRTSINKNCGS